MAVFAMKPVMMFQAESGRTYATEFEALKDDFGAMLAKACGNDPIARQATEALTIDIVALHTLVTALHDARPEQTIPLPLPKRSIG